MSWRAGMCLFCVRVYVCVSLCVWMCCSCALSSMWWWCQLDHLLLCLPNTLEPGAQTLLNHTALLWSGGGGSKHDREPFDYRCLIRKNLQTHRDGLYVPHGKCCVKSCQFQVTFAETTLYQNCINGHFVKFTVGKSEKCDSQVLDSHFPLLSLFIIVQFCLSQNGNVRKQAN